MTTRLRPLVLVAIMTALAGSSFGYNKTMYPYTLPAGKGGDAMGCEKAQPGQKLELGKWYTNFEVCKKYADDNGLPMFAIWGNKSCIHCWYTETCFKQKAFTDWQSTHDAGQVILCFMAGGDDTIDQAGSTAYNWMWKTGGAKLDAYPFTVFWWKKNGVNVRRTGDQLCAGGGTVLSFTDATIPTRVNNIISAFESAFAGWSPKPPEPPYAGGYFTATNAPYASMQAEKTTKYVDVALMRTAVAATNQAMKISAPGKAAKSVTVSWSANQAEQTVRIDDFDTAWFSEGKDVTLELMDGDAVKSVATISCVVMKNGSGNPKWIGESFDFGEWTMDLDKAKDLVKKTSGGAYTLVSVQGSLWCPDCANVERNFLGVEDAQGNNRFAAWAKEKKIALVTVDIPNYTGTNATDYASPCLLSRTAYESTLAREKEYPQSGAEQALMSPMWRSGTGYLTRKMVSDAEAAKVLARNHDLVVKNTEEGGFHRPEDGNKNRTGVPIFVLLRKDGSVAARLTRMASVSPIKADQANFDNYLKRFDEMLWIADNDQTEVANNSASEGSVSFRANGGREEQSLCNADMVDTFRMEGVGGNALQSVTVKGTSDAEVTVSFQTLGADGKAETLGTPKTGKLSTGVTLDYTFTKAGSYYVKVEGANITSDVFRIDSPMAEHFQKYAISGTVVLVPQGDAATAQAPDGSDGVTMRLVKDTLYRIDGLKSCSALMPADGAPAGFYVATASTDATLTLAQVGGTVTYQIWTGSTVGFMASGRSVPESYCDATLHGEALEIPVVRTGGISGALKVKVNVNAELTDLYPERDDMEPRFDLETTELAWADGETGTKSIKVRIHDIDGICYGDGRLVLDLEMTEGAYACGIDGEKGRYTLVVTEEDKAEPGRAQFAAHAEPAFAAKKTVYVREGDVATLYLERIEAADGLASVRLDSNVPEVTFATTEARDLQPDLNDGNRLHFYWARNEIGEKPLVVSGVKAGVTAKISIAAYGDFKVISSASSVNVIGLRKDAPGFETPVKSVDACRYLALNELVGLTNVEGGDVSFAKKSGTLPAGLKVSYDAEAKAMKVAGVVTAKPGTYAAVYQVTEKRGTAKVPGLAVQLAITVTDPTQPGPGGEPAVNPAVAKARTVKSVPVVDQANRRLMGLLQVTVPPTGKVSAKFTGVDGSVSFSAKGWTSLCLDGTLSADLTTRTAGYVLEVEAHPDGRIDALMTDPAGNTYQASVEGASWSKSDPATAWKGYYTVAVRRLKTVAENPVGCAPTGDGYLTLKMDTDSACRSGTFKVAGLLPNGTKVSGSSVLSRDGSLSVFTTSSKDSFSGVAAIAKNAVVEKNRRCVESPNWCDAFWSHAEKKGNAFEVSYTLHGAYYDAKDDLGACCDEDYERRALNFYLEGESLAPVAVEADAVKVGTPNPASLKLSLNRTTGVVTGTFTLDALGRVSYAGVIVSGWGEGCGCGAYDETMVFLPFVSGACWWKDSTTRQMTGAQVRIDK